MKPPIKFPWYLNQFPNLRAPITVEVIGVEPYKDTWSSFRTTLIKIKITGGTIEPTEYKGGVSYYADDLWKKLTEATQ